MQDLQGWMWITVHQIFFCDRRSRSQNSHSCGILTLDRRYFVTLLDISLLSSLFAVSFCYFRITKRAPGHNHENAIYQLEHCA